VHVNVIKHMPSLTPSEQLIVNTLALINAIGGGAFLLITVIYCNSFPLKQLHYWPDFMVYYAAGHMAAHTPSALYDYPAYMDFYAQLKSNKDIWLGYIAAPPLAVLFIPLSMLNFTHAFLVWSIFNLSLCMVLAYSLFRLAITVGLKPIAFFFGSCVFGCWVTVNILSKGQLSLLVAVAFAHFFIGLLEQKNKTPALCLAILLLIKPPLFLPLFACLTFSKSWRIGLYATIFLMIYTTGAQTVLGSFHVWIDYLHMMQRYNDQIHIYDIHMINLKGMAYSWAHWSNNMITNIAYLFVCIGCAVWAFIRNKPIDILSAAGVTLFGFLFSSYALIHDCIIFLPLVVVLTASVNEKRWPVNFMFLFFMFTSYIAYPVEFFMRVTLLMLCALAIFLNAVNRSTQHQIITMH